MNGGVQDGISIHAPHTRSDHLALDMANSLQFQSTLLIRGATTRAASAITTGSHFNPRSSYEERHIRDFINEHMTKFQSTLLIRGAT